MDPQTSDGVLIVVTGDIVLTSESLRHFVQTFFLDAQQAGPNPSYYVRNSVLRLLLPMSPRRSSKTAPPSRQTTLLP